MLAIMIAFELLAELLRRQSSFAEHSINAYSVSRFKRVGRQRRSQVWRHRLRTA
jgi:hypothetical protein